MIDQHPVFMALAAPRRRELLDNEPFVALGEAAQCELLDHVERTRELLDYRDRSDRFNDPRRREKDAGVLARSLAAALKIIDPHKPNARLSEISRIRADLINSLSDLNRDSIPDAINELKAFTVTARRIEEALKRIPHAPPQGDLQQRTRRNNHEALDLLWLLAIFEIRVYRTAESARSDPGLVLMGLLADPPTSADVMSKRLRPKGRFSARPSKKASVCSRLRNLFSSFTPEETGTLECLLRTRTKPVLPTSSAWSLAGGSCSSR
jgi:hypothetical protein